MKSLICVLDWGLGHASRSLALADRLRREGDTTVFASCGRAREFLRRERPGEKIYELPAYAVRYPTSCMPLNVAYQFPKWSLTVLRERRRTAQLARELGVDRIISDSRFGCYVPGFPSVLLTHQLHPLFGFRPASLLYTRYLQRFTEIWVPDHAGSPLSGKLSASTGYRRVRYIGPLSRLKLKASAKEQRWRTLSLLSGPEPMRSRLEAQLMRQLPRVPGRHLLIRGVPSDGSPTRGSAVEVIDFADTEVLERELPAAEFILCRGGYSTLMDLAGLPHPKLVLVPTPGQTEQEYLARLWSGAEARPGPVPGGIVKTVRGQAEAALADVLTSLK